MGFVYVPMRLRAPSGARRTVEMLVDSGAVWSCLPEADWQALGLEATRECRFTLADGTQIRRSVGECSFRYEEIEATSPVILGERDDVALIGVVTLETLGLVLNPYDRTLQPMKALLARVGTPAQAVPAAIIAPMVLS